VFLDHGKAMDLSKHSKAEMALPAAVAQGGRTWKTHLHFSGLIIKANLGHTFRINTYPQLRRDGVPSVFEVQSQTLIIDKFIYKYSSTNRPKYYFFSVIYFLLALKIIFFLDFGVVFSVQAFGYLGKVWVL
jgi:hypothetical protein